MSHSDLTLREGYTDTFAHAFDEKGRITVPSEWRSEAHEKRLLVFRSQENCLKVYPASWLGAQMAKLKDASMNDPRRRILQNLATAAQTVECDAQGRIMIKEKLRQVASLKKKTVLAGSFDHFQIWDADDWKNQEEATVTVEKAALEAGL